jgi:hypothetical protein
MLRWLPFVMLTACAHAPVESGVPHIEIQLDDGKPVERPLMPSKTFELLVRFDPKLPAYRARRVRFLLAQAGRIFVSVYSGTADDHPGELIYSIDRDYAPQYTSNGTDGKWVIEVLDLPVQTKPIWIGFWSLGGSNDPRLWASNSESGQAFQRDPDPDVPLYSLKLPRTPLVRLELEPTDPPAPTSSKTRK